VGFAKIATKILRRSRTLVYNITKELGEKSHEACKTLQKYINNILYDKLLKYKLIPYAVNTY